jgi:pimeloyl-ACP methyl ester carboxylesterase
LLIYNSGLDGTGQLFFKQTPDLSENYRVVTYRSREGGRFTYEDLTDDIASIIRDLGETQATILGESFGGTVALNFALRYPHLVERLVVVNSFPRFRRRFTIEAGPLLASAVPFHLLFPVRRAASLVALLADGVSREDRRVFWKAIRTVSREAYAQRLKLIAGLDLEPRLSEIQSPTLFIAGDKDLLIPSVSEAFGMASRMPHAAVRVINGAGHACLLGNRVRLAELLAE